MFFNVCKRTFFGGGVLHDTAGMQKVLCRKGLGEGGRIGDLIPLFLRPCLSIATVKMVGPAYNHKHTATCSDTFFASCNQG